MGLLARLVGAEGTERRSGFSILENPAKDPALAALFGSSPSTAGVSVTERTALNYSAVWAAVNVISGDLSSLPLPLYKRRADGGRERATGHPVFKLLRHPNPEMGSMAFRNTIQAHVLTWGNGYAEIERNGAGRAVGLWPIDPDRVTPDRSAGRRLVYRVRNPRGGEVTLRPDQVFHIAGLAFDGLQGYSPVRMARETIGLGLATEKFGAAFFGNGAWAGVVLEHPDTLSTDAHLRLKESWNEIHQGPTKGHRVTILEKGMKASRPLTYAPEDAQFLQTRIFQNIEVARWFNLAVHKLRDMENAHYNNIEHEGISHVTDTLRPWAVRWEQEIDRKLLTEAEQEEFYAEHLFDALQRGDQKARYDAHAVGRQWGWRSVNEVRRMENENPIGPEGDVYLVASNMIAAEAVPDMKQAAQVNSLGALVRAGYDPAASVSAVGLPAIKHSGAPPVTVQSEGEPGPAVPPPPPPAPEPKRARLVAQMRAIFIEAHGRLLRKEAAAARRISGRGGDALRVWTEEFYAKHRAQLAEALLPALRAHLVAMGDGVGAEARAEAVAAEHVGRSVQELTELLDTKPKVSELEGSVDRLVSRWEIARPGEMADLVFAEDNGR